MLDRITKVAPQYSTLMANASTREGTTSQKKPPLDWVAHIYRVCALGAYVLEYRLLLFHAGYVASKVGARSV